MVRRRLTRKIKYVISIVLAGNFEVSWQRPKHVELVIWDEEGSQSLIDAIQPASHYILKVRNHPIFLHPLVVWGTLFGLLSRRNSHYSTVIKFCKPRAVATFIDNDHRFHRLASKVPTVNFVAIQNGVRAVNYSGYPHMLGPQASYESKQLCWGQLEIDNYKSLGYRFKSVIAVGSLRNNIFFQAFDASTELVVESFDILLISTFRNFADLQDPPPGYVAYLRIVRFLSSYVTSHSGLRIGIAMCRPTDHPDYILEELFYKQQLGDLITVVPQSEDGMSSYLLTEKSDVIMSTSSALGIESLARGRKTLMCASHFFDFFEDQAFFPDWTLPRMDQEIFDEAITKLLSMTRESFITRNSESIKYFMNPPHEKSISTIRKEMFG